MNDLEQLKEKHPNLHKSLLGLNQPEDFSNHSKALIRQKLTAVPIKKTPIISMHKLIGIGAIAASVLLLMTINLNPTSVPQDSAAVVEDGYVTSLLLDTLLLEEEVIDQVIQESLLDNFEENLALN